MVGVWGSEERVKLREKKGGGFLFLTVETEENGGNDERICVGW